MRTVSWLAVLLQLLARLWITLLVLVIHLEADINWKMISVDNIHGHYGLGHLHDDPIYFKLLESFLITCLLVLHKTECPD